MISYQFAKDFAGPAATALAAGVAAWITWLFSERQARIAEQQAATSRQQASTALDQLRFNLFEKRVAIYDAAQELIRLLLNGRPDKQIGAHEIFPLYAKLREARFYFTSELVSSLETLITQEATVFLGSRHEPGSQRNLDASQALVRRMESLPDLFGKELRFEQLTALNSQQ